MKHETSPTCPICSATMEEKKNRLIAVKLNCPICGYTTDMDILQAIREEAIIKGEFDEEYLWENENYLQKSSASNLQSM